MELGSDFESELEIGICVTLGIRGGIRIEIRVGIIIGTGSVIGT